MSKIDNIPKRKRAELYRQDYKNWKKTALSNFGYFPVFKPLKESFLLRNISGNSMKLYLYLGLMSDNENGETWVSIETMAKYFGKSKRTISAWLKELEEAKLIKRIQLKKDGVAHTFLTPYGFSHLNNKDSLQKKENIWQGGEYFE